MVISNRITIDQRRRLEYIDSEDYSLVMEKTQDDLSGKGMVVDRDYLEQGIYALKQYYAVALLDPANAHAVTVPIDPFWHSHILFTREYRIFCEAVVGEYMEHIPLDKTSKSKVENVKQLYNYTLKILPKLFSDINKKFWPDSAYDNIICWHKGNQTIYPEVQKDRLFEPCGEGRMWAYPNH